jgi:hypothetical protein
MGWWVLVHVQVALLFIFYLLLRHMVIQDEVAHVFN